MEKDYSGKIKQMRNLALFKDKTDEEIIAWIKKREEQQKVERTEAPEQPVKTGRSGKRNADDEDAEYEAKYQENLQKLMKDYGVDMNDSNDMETLKLLADHQVQADIVKKQIRRLNQQEELDTRTLKNLGDYQKGLIGTISELSEKLGIQRKQRKEKQVDSIPQFVSLVRTRAREVFERTTIIVRCEQCEIDLARYWENFPDKVRKVSMEIDCWKCGELVIYNK